MSEPVGSITPDVAKSWRGGRDALCERGRFDESAHYLDVPHGAEKRAGDLAHNLYDVLQERLVCPPVHRRGGEALLEHVSHTLGLPRRAVTLERGASSRDKWVRIEGMSAEDARAQLEHVDAR